jgi:hypothetical protein
MGGMADVRNGIITIKDISVGIIVKENVLAKLMGLFGVPKNFRRMVSRWLLNKTSILARGVKEML